MSERIAFFGLRTNVGFFASNVGVAKLSNRLKVSALLYDRVLLEGGLYECTITDDGSFEFVGPLRDAAHLKPLRTRRGARAGVRMALSGSSEYRTVIAGETQRNFRSQFVGEWREIEPLGPDWIQLVDISRDAHRAAADLARRWTFDEAPSVASELRGQSQWLRQKVHANLNLDLARASVIGAELVPDGSNVALLNLKTRLGASKTVATGERPLRFVLPDIDRASWADIAEIRADRGFSDLRAKLRELDATDVSEDQLRERFVNELLTELEQRRPRWLSVAVSVVVSLLGGILPPLAAVGTMLELGEKALSAETGGAHWTAAVIRARGKLAQRTAAPLNRRPASASRSRRRMTPGAARTRTGTRATD